METTSFLVGKQECLYRVDAAEILYIQAEGRYTTIHCAEGTFLTQQSLVKWGLLLAKANFIQINKRTLVNAQYIRKIMPKDNLLLLDDQSHHVLGRRYKEQLWTQFIRVW